MIGTRARKEHYRRNYSEDFKREAVATYEESGKSRAEICRLLDISCGSLLKEWSVHLGLTRQGLYGRVMRYEAKLSLEKAVLLFVKKIRHTQDKVGMRKLFMMFKTEHKQYVIGRDGFMNMYKKHRLTHHLTVKKRYKSADIKSEKLGRVDIYCLHGVRDKIFDYKANCAKSKIC